MRAFAWYVIFLGAGASGAAWSCSTGDSKHPFGLFGPGAGGSGGAGVGGAGGGTVATAAGSGGTGGSTLSLSTGTGGPMDSDQDGVDDEDEPLGDTDGDGTPDYLDPINDAPPPAIKLTKISTTFNTPIGIDFHEPTNTVVMTVNYGNGGYPYNFERIQFDGTREQFSPISGLSDEIKIATARAGNPQGFPAGDLFVGNGLDGQLVRITDNGKQVMNPWVDFPGDSNGLLRGSLYVDRTGVFNGDLLVVTTNGGVWRVNLQGQPTKVAALGVHLEGLAVVPDKPARFGPLAGRMLIGAEEQGNLYAMKADGTFDQYQLGVNVEDIDIVTPKENFFGVNFGTSSLLGAEAAQFATMTGDIVLTQEMSQGNAGLYRLKWTGSQVVAEPIPTTPDSAPSGQWEHVTFAGAGIVEIPPPN